MKVMKKSVFNLAWQFVRNNNMNLSEALKKAWANVKLSLKMRTRVVKFIFLKKDGSIRRAFGTLDPTYTPATKGTGKRSPLTQTYFDKELNAFRCFRKENLLWVENC